MSDLGHALIAATLCVASYFWGWANGRRRP